ncbi:MULTISPECIES: response regulator transcription factor [unclassified Fusibacter]|uniref:response regulator transcription factor n=1 Tax=unclassified Fusibacter TaxID=2624464 RepID=UPI0010111CA5|nr:MULTISPECIES: response regulator transcription factor [unclassified Fusibacter]MCK8060398.1 response regulator transcription factor [Fusibacter sp. A2]NPE20313.1 response regulator transcription factor [Fusibacter sp. A1]RXV63519.1 DNA-binding response regulator [Fusibacter sp. A1]
MKYKLLVCDDDKDIVDAICIYLKHEGIDAYKAYNGKQAVEILDENEVHLVMMDIMMPEQDGLTTVAKMRETSNVPIIFLSAKSENTDKIIGLNFGADDYITKPYNPLEMVARVKAQLRRYTQLGNRTVEEHILKTGGLEMDTHMKIVTVDGAVISVTATEWKILSVLMNHLGRVFSIDELYERAWNDVAVAANNAVAVHIRRIREKIEIDPKNPKYLKVVWGIGYKIEKYDV